MMSTLTDPERSQDAQQRLAAALWRIHNRPEKPDPWTGSGNLPWHDPAFSTRMLREHLDESHGAASRVAAERQQQIDWLWRRLKLSAGDRLLDVTCGPGLYVVPLAERGLDVTGLDFAPASIAYAQNLAEEAGVAGRCAFQEVDVRAMSLPENCFDAAILLYGQLAVFPRDTAAEILVTIGRSLKPGGRLCLELLDPAKIDKSDSSWWFTDDSGLWGEAPFLHLGERFWDETTGTSSERYLILDLETGELDEYILSDQAYRPEEMIVMLRAAGFTNVDLYPAWDGLTLYDAAEWLVYIARRDG